MLSISCSFGLRKNNWLLRLSELIVYNPNTEKQVIEEHLSQQSYNYDITAFQFNFPLA